MEEIRDGNINILLITVRADFGGAQQHMDLLINNYPSNINLFIAAPMDEPYYFQWQKNKKVIDIFLIPYRKFSLLRFIQLIKYIVNKKIDIVHSHGKGAGLYSRLIKLFVPRIKVVHTFHGLHIQKYSFLKKRLFVIYERTLSFFTDKFINVSNGEYQLCMKNKVFNGEKSVIIYNCVNQLGKIKDARHKLNLPEGKIIIATISRFDYPKNMDLAYDIANRCRYKKNLLFLWVGDGEDKLRIEKKVKEEGLDNIIFTGFKRNIEEYLSATDIYLSTSRWEGLPSAVLEALSLGIPIVATNVAGNNEIVEDNKNGFLFDLSSPDSAVEKLDLLAGNKALYSTFSLNSEEIFKRKINVDNMIENTVAVYKSCFNK